MTPIRTYGEDEARALGLLVDEDGDDDQSRPADGDAGRARRREQADVPPGALAHARRPPQQDGDQVKTDGSNAVQLLLLIGGISLVPALLFTVTGFTRILIVLGFIRSGLGTPTAPPNQVLVGIALFLTLFVMAPTFTKVKDDAIVPLSKGKITKEVAFKRAEAPMREFMFDQTRTKDLALFAKLGKLAAAEDARGHPDLRPDPGVHHLRAQDGVPDRVPDLPAVPDHRPRRRRDADVDGHGDAAARLHLAAVQDPPVRPGRRLEPRHPLAGGELPHMSQDQVISICVSAMEVAMKIALPILLVGLVLGLIVSIFQAVTQIQEQTLSFIPKIVGLGRRAGRRSARGCSARS